MYQLNIMNSVKAVFYEVEGCEIRILIFNSAKFSWSQYPTV